MSGLVRFFSSLMPSGHPLHDPAVRVFEYSGLAKARERLRAHKRRNAVFIWVPKTAGTSLQVALDAPVLKSLRLVKYRFIHRGIVTFGHMDYAELCARQHVSPQFDASAYKFAFCRNPYDRAVSLHAYLRRIGKLPEDETFLSFCRRLRRDGCEPIGLYNALGLSQCNPQVRWIERIRLDFLGRTERIETDARTVAAALHLTDMAVPHENVSRHDDFMQYYCSESREIVEDFYREDFRHLGYPHFA